MVGLFHTPRPLCSCRVSATVLASALFCGFLSGAYTATLAGPSSVLLMHAASSCMSFAGLLLPMLLPFLFTAFAVYISQRWLLVPVAFLKSFIFSYLGAGILLKFSDSGWLFYLLLMFSDLMTMPILCWLWLRISGNNRDTALRCLVVPIGMLAGIIYLDYQYISPFLVSLLS